MPQYLIIVENTSSNFSAYSPDVPGCTATGTCVEEAVIEMTTALEELFETMETLPEPKGLTHYMNDESVKKESTDFVLLVDLDQDY